MAEIISLSLAVQAANGPSCAVSKTWNDLAAYDKADITVPKAGTYAITMTPSVGAVHLLLITAGAYSADLKYSVTNGAQNVPLDGPHLFAGAGAVGLLQEQETFTFANGGSEDVEVSILVGRKAV